MNQVCKYCQREIQRYAVRKGMCPRCYFRLRHGWEVKKYAGIWIFYKTVGSQEKLRRIE